MEPNTPQAPQVNQPQGLDPAYVNLARAIGKHESGMDYNAPPNKDGASGAYQMTPSFIEKWAPLAGIQYTPGTPLSMADQNKLAYTAVSTMATKGDPGYQQDGPLKPSQIASAWYTGDPNLYATDPSYGTVNGTSVEQYVNDVKHRYQTLTGEQSSTAQPSTPPSQSSTSQPSTSQSPSTLDAILGLGAGVLGAGAGALRSVAPDIASGIGEDLGGPLGAIGLGSVVSNLMGGGSSGGTGGGTDTSSSQSPQDQILSQTEASIPQASAESDMLKTILNNAMKSGPQSLRAYAQDAGTQQAVDTAARYGLFDQNENGQFDFNSAKRDQLANELGNAKDAVIAENNGTSHIMGLGNYAGSYIGADRTADNRERQKSGALAQEMISADSGGGQQMTSEQMRKAQKEHYAQAAKSYDSGKTSAEMLAHKAVANAYGRAIRDNIQDPDQKELYDRISREEGNLIKTKKLAKKLNQRAIPKTPSTLKAAIFKAAARYAEIYLGDKIGGPVGAVLGFYVGEKLNRVAFKHLSKTEFDKPGVKAALNILKQQKPIIYHKIKKVAASQGIDIDATQPQESHKEESKSLEDLAREAKKDKPTEKVEDYDTMVSKLIGGKGTPKGKTPLKKGLIKPPSR